MIHIVKRHIRGPRHRVIHEGSGQQLAVLIIDGVFQQRLADALRHAAMHLALHQHRVQQAAGVVTSFVAYAVVMVPLMIVFAFEVGQSWAPGVPGLFVGMTCGSATHAALNLLLALRWTDFEKASEVAYDLEGGVFRLVPLDG